MKHIKEGYIQLAAAIVNSGIRCHDEFFLKSDWCKMLTEYVIEHNRVTANSSGNHIINIDGNLSGLTNGKTVL